MFRFSALLCAMVVLVTSCTQDATLEPQVKPAADGSEILFGARAGFENAGESRTEYSGVDYTYGNKNYERIDWTFDTDQIEIYSPNTANSNNTYYQVKNAGINPDETIKEGETHLHDYAYLQRMSDSGNLQWNGDGNHTFYAMYPSERMFDEPATEANGWVGTTVDMGIAMNETVLTGVIPNSQAQTFDEEASDDNTFVFKPDMRFAYMAAKTTTTRANGNVGLTFVPLVTAVEVELAFPDDGTATKYHDFMIGEVEVTTMSNDTDTKTQPLAGPFTADLTSWDGTSLPTVTIPEAGPSIKFYNSIHLSTRKMNDAGTMSLPITLNEGKSLKFTVFLLPNQKIEDLCIKVSGTGAEAYVGKTLTGTEIPAGLKTRITKVKVPAIAESTTNPFQDASNWMKDLKDDVSFRRLSLPGTGGSFSYNYKEEDRDEYAEQFAGMDLAAQWKLGIRAFEVIVNRPSSASTSLGSENVKCNKKSMGTTFNQVMTDLTTLVSETYPNECAVVILTYQPEGLSPNRNGEAFAGSLYTWYNSFANKGVLKKYTPDMTMADARGHVMVLVRLNQKDEKESGGWFNLESSVEYGVEHYNAAVAKLNTITNNPFVLINGAGTAKDRWGARGYKRVNADGTAYYFPHISNSYSGANIIESFMESELYTTNDGQYTYSANASYNGTNYTISRPKAGTPNDLRFGFYTDGNSGENATICWFQEWHRVVATPVTYNNHHWFESYYEKLDNAKTTYDMAVSGDEQYKDYIFVNSLCGYLAESGDGIVPSTGLTYGGSGGNYAGLAEKINPAFYQYVYQRSQENTQGPTGIVLMDYVTNDSSLPHYYLPGLIIANNRKTGNAK